MGDPAQRVGVVDRPLELGVDDRVNVPGFVAAGVADGALAPGVGPAGAVGDQLAVVAAAQPADDLGERAELAVGRIDQGGADVMRESEVAPGGIGVPGAGADVAGDADLERPSLARAMSASSSR